MSYSSTLTKVNYLFGLALTNAVKLMHFDFESVRVCYFDIDLGMSSLSNKWEQFF